MLDHTANQRYDSGSNQDLEDSVFEVLDDQLPKGRHLAHFLLVGSVSTLNVIDDTPSCRLSLPLNPGCDIVRVTFDTSLQDTSSLGCYGCDLAYLSIAEETLCETVHAAELSLELMQRYGYLLALLQVLDIVLIEEISASN